MDFTIDKKEQYSLIDLKETFLGAEIPAALENVARLALKSAHNIILNLEVCQDLDTAGAVVLRKVNRLCANDLGIFIVVTKNEDLIDKLDQAKIQDLEIFYTVEEAIDAVFMHDLENEFGAGEDGYDAEDYDTGNE
jgi:anti-anti-sigma regulatory factor